ncbi:Uncharacterized protein {ECO:0000313/EMBL:CCF10726.1} [Pantoea ananatis]|nr:hypothetical protein PANA5342_3333 [Pantoea ananatis LMG 5342]CRH28439.1 Uncharacterized protein {ECO:0000313/EMBL:CCF10726.1} [Pantoea ananatis]CRH32845.1 Uncharacterized protein BN1183_AN_00600 [Pantoea ananatis]CRH37092.1 Uncharacterized protein {ECO:0000313/EMBL:CCF10726.1} [Pantoea ananatis]
MLLALSGYPGETGQSHAMNINETQKPHRITFTRTVSGHFFITDKDK